MADMASRTRKPPPSDDALLQAHVASVLGSAGVASGRLVLGLSGGMDSMVLLDILSGLRHRLTFALSALHVNHQLSPRADEWNALCAQRCAGYEVSLRSVRVEVPRDSGEGLEAAARAARYAVFRDIEADAIVLAQHLDDQAETLLLQLLRGAGPRGLAAMPGVRPIAGHGSPLLLRPLLDVERSRLEAYARDRGLVWVEDESNFDTDLDRNYLRHEVLPRLAARFPAYRQTWLRASRNFADLSQVADDQAAADAAGALEAGGLRVSRLAALSAARAGNLLRWWLAQEGLPFPRREQIEEFLRQLSSAGAGAQPVMEVGGARVYRQRGLLRIGSPDPRPEQPWIVHWRGEPEVMLPPGLGRLQFARATGAGLAAARLAGLDLVVRSRRGGERIKLAPERPTRTLKNLLQEARIPHWQRDRLPLLACGEQVLWVAQLGLDCRLAAQAGEEGVLPTWLPC
jgi:tRNA(Ile)-lysidine synthase